MTQPLARFNLVDEPWIPCRLGRDGPDVRELSLLETLRRAPEIAAIAAETPLMTVTLHRLLLTVLHRCFGPASVADWRRLWEAGSWDNTVITDYLEKWRRRFDLFDDERPFYQTAAVDFNHTRYPVVRQFQIAGNRTLWDHGIEETPTAIDAATAARLLVAFQAFDVGGMKTGENGKDSCDASPLSKCAVGVIRGESLFRTLLLNLHRYAGADGEPYDFDPAADKPAWERDEPPQPVDRAPDGYLDYLTWQSRRLRLRPEIGPNGEITVAESIVMKGYQLPSWDDRQRAETMMAFQARRQAKGGETPWGPVGFNEDKALWRDSLAIFQSVAGQSARPKMLDWLDELAGEELVSRRDIVPVDFYGFATDKANALFWRHEQLRLPLICLDNADIFGQLQRALTLADRAAGLLSARMIPDPAVADNKLVWSPCRRLAGELLASGDRQPDRQDIEGVVTRLAPQRGYWIALATPFQQLVEDLARTAAANGNLATPSLAWVETVEKAAREAFAAATAGLDTSARSLRAVAIADRTFRRMLAATIRPRIESLTEEVAA